MYFKSNINNFKLIIMAEEKYCYIHKDIPTRLTCTSCGKFICPKCMVAAAVGYRCPDCGQRNISHIEKITPPQYLKALSSATLTGIVAGLIWTVLKNYGVFISILVAYAVGFCVAKTIVKVIGNKIGKKIQILSGTITFISMFYNPIILTINLYNGFAFLPLLISFSYYNFSSIYSIVAGIIAVWASIRHFRF
ncbi:MAG: hypothetical protein PHV68_00205 [Candidatus Gastranaerophilales bacterium]|nr:hypothetical protein [Candidatus Gastranaerophilales bacterium]